MKTLMIGLAAAAIAGCASSTQITLPDGTAGITLNCSGPYMSIEQCLVKAGKECPRGYNVLGASNEQTAMNGASGYANASRWGGQAGYGAYGWQASNRVMIISCRG